MGSETYIRHRRFATRLRAIRYLTDRRSSCLVKLVASAHPVLTDARVAELDDVDRVARRLAQRAGPAHPAAVVPAKTDAGKPAGGGMGERLARLHNSLSPEIDER